MNRTRIYATGALALAAVWLLSAHAQASFIDWTIDATKSKVSLAFPDTTLDLDGTTVTVRIRNQSGTNGGPWNVGNTAAITGILETDYYEILGNSINFLPSAIGVMTGVNSGSYRPNPAAFNPGNTNAENPDGQYGNTTTAAGVFGARARASVSFLTVDAGFFSFRDVSFDLASGTIPVGGGGTTFPASATSFGIIDTTLDFDGISIAIIGQPIPDSVNVNVPGAVSPNNLAGAASIVDTGHISGIQRMMTIPINMIVPFDLGGGIIINATATGSIVAFAFVPEPSTFILGAGILPAAVILYRNRRRLRVKKT